MADVFLSYAKATARAVRPIAKALQDEGYEVWWDAELPVHRSYSDVIAEQIAAAKAVVVIWSSEAAKSAWVRSEADEGREARKLVQILIDDTALPMPFGQIQFADLRGWRGDRAHPQWRKVVQSLTEITNRPPVETIAAQPRWIARARAVRPAYWAAAALTALAMAGAAVWLLSARPRPTGVGPGANAATPASATVSGIAQPSFDCAQAGSQTERYICAEPAVAAAELEMAKAYHAAMAKARGKDKDALKSSQRDFLINLTAAAHNRTTFIGLYTARTAELKARLNR